MTRQLLDDLLQQIVAVESFTADGRSAFVSDLRTQYAVIRAYELIGEIVKRLPSELLSASPHIPWKRIAGFRDFLIHRYDDVDLAIVWGAVEQLPTLKQAVEAMLRDFDNA